MRHQQAVLHEKGMGPTYGLSCLILTYYGMVWYYGIYGSMVWYYGTYGMVLVAA
jgi:hypothetical protein